MFLYLDLSLKDQLKDGYNEKQTQPIFEDFINKLSQLPVDHQSTTNFRKAITDKLLAAKTESKGFWDNGIARIKSVFALKSGEIENFLNQIHKSGKVRAFKLQFASDNLVYSVTPENENTYYFMGRVFYGIRCLYAHGNTDETLNHGVLSSQDKRMSELQESDIRFKIHFKCTFSGHENPLEPNDEDNEKLVKYIWNLWHKARSDKNGLLADFDLANNISKFMLHMVLILREICNLIPPEIVS